MRDQRLLARDPVARRADQRTPLARVVPNQASAPRDFERRPKASWVHPGRLDMADRPALEAKNGQTVVPARCGIPDKDRPRPHVHDLSQSPALPVEIVHADVHEHAPRALDIAKPPAIPERITTAATGSGHRRRSYCARCDQLVSRAVRGEPANHLSRHQRHVRALGRIDHRRAVSNRTRHRLLDEHAASR